LASAKPDETRRGLADISNVASINNGSKASLAHGKKVASKPFQIAADQQREPALKQLQIDEIDTAVARDPRFVADYVNEIYRNYLKDEPKHLPKENFMAEQTDVTPRMRAILIDWLVEVHFKFKLQAQTLYICVNILDRYLERTVVHRDELQLIGCTALWMAAKVEEIYAPDVHDIVQVADRAFKRADLLAMEGTMLNALGFAVTFPTQYVFLQRYMRVGLLDKRQKLLASYCVERTLQEYAFVKYKPSLVAAASVLVAMESLPCNEANRWTPALEKHTSYGAAALQQCAKDMRDVVTEAEHKSLLAVRKKYLTEENGYVARVVVAKPEV